MLKTMCRIAIVVLTAIFVMSPFHSFDMRFGIFVCAVSILVCYFPFMSGSFKWSALTFFLGGAALLLIYRQPFEAWIIGTVSMLNIIAILAVMQLFSIPIRIGDYHAALETLYYKKFNNESRLFFFVSIVTHFFASFLLFGTIPVMISLFGNLLKNVTTHYRRFAATAISRSYSMVVLWAPGGVNILLIQQTTGVAWADLFVPGLILALVGIGLSQVLERSHLSSKEQGYETNDHPAGRELSVGDALKKLSEVFAVIIGLILIMAIFEQCGFATSTTRVLFSGLIVVSLWLIHLRKHPGIRQGFAEYWNTSLLKTMDLSVLFICLGLFSTSVIRSGILLSVQPFLAEISAYFGPTFFLIIVPVIITLCALIGLHPFVSLVIVGKMIVVLNLGVPMIPLALALSLGGAISYMISPFAGIVLTLARFLDCRPIEIAWHWNWLFCVSYLLIGIALIVVFAVVVT